jgi:hypothetical protein
MKVPGVFELGSEIVNAEGVAALWNGVIPSLWSVLYNV